MNEPSLPDLLEALGELFLLPGAFDRGRFEALGRASWVGLGITPALQALVIQDATGLDVAYAALFLHGFGRPTLHLEASVQRAGLLADPETLEGLRRVYEAAGLQPDPAFQPDHLGILLALLAHLLRGLAEAPRSGLPRPQARALECAAQALIEDHLGPLAERVGAALDGPDTHPFYRCSGRLLRRSVELAEQVLGRPFSAPRRANSPPDRRPHAP